ncbi:hypothetical protein [Salinarimonas soli]|uniref:Uncharacterized protein n=1 Tax=Salinarimonas soli TaxID=1638099 RepID=A0A5B2VAB2_9HYPH|nr:hypothetical protein [Salinarimonas soli]KAA2235951.1 hypothetical protein F0L46_16940 [Salinarimonas soli]
MPEENHPGRRGPLEGDPANDPLPGSKSVREAERRGTAPKPSDELPPAGPHDRPDLVNPDSTPGTGVLQEPGAAGDIDNTSS